MKVGHVTERSDSLAPAFLDGEEQEHSGTDLGNPGRLMAQLSEGEPVSLHLPKTNPTFPTLACDCSSVCTRVLPVSRYGPSDASFGSAGSADEWSDCYRSNGGSYRSVQHRTVNL